MSPGLSSEPSRYVLRRLLSQHALDAVGALVAVRISRRLFRVLSVVAFLIPLVAFLFTVLLLRLVRQ